MRAARMTGARAGAILAVVAAVLLGACASEEPDPVAQPAPDVTTFERGLFDDLPRFPRSEPLGPRNEEDGVIARSFKVPGAAPEQVLEFYRHALEENWTMLAPVERLGVGTFRADWLSDDYRLRVSATRESELDSRQDASNTVVAQYSLTLEPL